ncbi:Chitinase 4 [Folsomia candida]|uniref:Chitinase 4 n=1 Tax=Folsomia candida TaxID=158441 RepID=A0A226DIE6_FOLCA|nr:Chitinase 4 [Folsomia candida]
MFAQVLLLLGLSASSVLGDCWQTGCQLDSWAVKGCDQYDRDTAGTEWCQGGGNMPTWPQFSAGVTNNGYPAPSQDQYNNFVKHAARWGRVTSKQESAMALAQFLHESDGLRAKREYACAQTQCPNSYRQPSCDAPGQYYYGRGYIQLSWCEWNYRPASRDIFGDDRLVSDPDQVARDESTAWATAWWFWGKNVHDKGGVQQGQFGSTTRAINGPLECDGANPGLAQKRFQIYGKVRQGFGLAGAGDPSGC